MKSKKEEKGGHELPNATTLWEKAQAGDRESLDQLMATHQGVVIAVLQRQGLGQLSYEEGLQAGRIGLWQAILKYKKGKGTAFTTYAWPAIMHEIWKAVKKKEKEEWLGKWPLEEEMAEGEAEREAIRQSLEGSLACLKEKWREVVKMRVGWEGEEPRTFREIGKGMGVSRQRAQQMYQEAIIKLKQPVYSYEIRSLRERQGIADYEEAERAMMQWRQRGRQR